MADLPTQLCLGVAEKKMVSTSTHHSPEKPDFFVLDMQRISLLTPKSTTSNNDYEMDPSLDMRVPVAMKLHKTLSRKGSQRGEGEETATTDRDHHHNTKGLTLSPLIVPSRDRSVTMVPSFVEGPERTAEASTLPTWHRRRGASPAWLDPRKVLFYFATASSMGTIMLIYFTLTLR